MLERLTASLASGGMMLVGLPLALDYVVRPGDTLSEIAQRHDTSVSQLVRRNGLGDGDRIVAGTTLRITGGKASGSTTSSRPGARRVVRYTVRPGDTPSGLAVRFHAWTAEVIARNGPVLRVGERVEIPVVPEAERRTSATPRAATPRRPAAPRRTAAPPRHRAATATPARSEVRRVITRTARHFGVDPSLALAVSWQESGWQMGRVSGAGAVGAMQVLPATGRWMEGVVGRPLDLRTLEDNATAGVALLDVLLAEAPRRRAVAGYYQGLAGVRRHGMYDDTRRYVANVTALQRRFAAGDLPD